MNRILNISNCYMLLVVLLLLQDVIYPGGTLLSLGIVGLFTLCSAVIALYTCIRYKLPAYFKGLNWLLILFTLYGILYIVSDPKDVVWANGSVDVKSYSYLLNIYLSLLPIYVFYYFTLIGQFYKQKIRFWAIVLMAVSALKFYSFYLTSIDSPFDEITNSYGYLFVGLIALLIFFEDKFILQFALLVICTVFITMSMKRGAVLTAGFSLIPFVLYQWKRDNKIQRIALTILIVSFVIGIVYMVFYMLHTSDYFISRIESTLEGNSSERDELFIRFWQYYTEEAHFGEQLVGGGANQTLRIGPNFAHNDWLEILINQGLLGCLFYIIYWWLFWREQKKCARIAELSQARWGLIICFVASGMMTFYSMSYANLPIGIAMTIGICLGQITHYQYQQKTTPLNDD